MLILKKVSVLPITQADHQGIRLRQAMTAKPWCYLSLISALIPNYAQAESSRESLTLDTIIISARKRDEAEQSVPLSTSVLNSDQLDVSSLQSNADLTRSTANVNFVDVGGQSGNLINIRGVGSFSPVAPDDTSAVFYIDEVAQSVYGTAPSLIDVERVEVLRGPQGTLFGRNSQGGAVSVVPNTPKFYEQYSLSGEVGNQGYYSSELVANDMLIEDKLAARLALGYSHQDGDIPNIVAGGKDGEISVGAARAGFLYELDDLTTAQLSLNYNREDNNKPRFLLRSAENFPTSAVNPRTDIEAESYGFNLKLDHEFEHYTLRSITALQRNTSSQTLDLSDSLVFNSAFGLPLEVFSTPREDVQNINFDETTYSQEIRFTSLEGDPFAWVAGVNLFRSEFSNDSLGQSVLPNFVQLNGRQANKIDTSSAALFGEVTLPLSKQLKLTTGLRGAYEEKQASYVFTGNGTPGVAALSKQQDSLYDVFATGRTALCYDWTQDLMTYASIARGYVTAGFPAVSVNNPFGRTEPSFPASKSWTYELGFKSQLMNQRIRLNGAVFFNDVSDGHLVVFNPNAALFTVNTLDYQSYGAELQTALQLSSDLELDGGIGYTHTELVDVPKGDLSGAKSGNQVPNVPKITANLGLTYRLSAAALHLPSGEMNASVHYQYVDQRSADVAHNFDLDSYGLVNTRLSWQRNGVSLYAFANNLFDEQYAVWGQNFGPSTQTVRVGQDRLIGLGANVEF